MNAFTNYYNIYEKVQMTAFCMQEFSISCLYVYETRRILKPGETFQKKRTRRVMRHLIYINVLIIVLDIILLGIEYANLWEIETTFKVALYSIKLKLEFTILNQLMDISKGSLRAGTVGSAYSHSHSHSLSHSHNHSHCHRCTHDHTELDTFGNGSGGGSGLCAHPGQGNADNANSKGYAVYASTNQSRFGDHSLEQGGVLKTTEVIVQDSDIDGVKTETKSMNGVAIATTKPLKSDSWQSQSSSEVEFTQAGTN
jgi:hypothetical protein